MDRLIGFIIAILLVVIVLFVISLIIYLLISGFNYLSFLIKDIRNIFDLPDYSNIQKKFK